ncbi:ATP-binding cassette domain-containing protein [Chitinimonas koreensis]|uniref:ATP-binding cassette domain-containing protein n=1 Tax=Chitinimonas koreensis TaxID=356302 RepID=UPI0003FE3F6B|nr:ATP-binding cassette domain-containing protein [Chitinimonas koreensis]QNM98694.1 ATP-binding cassette domain-containing protein [Chitinimonas koreensis]
MTGAAGPNLVEVAELRFRWPGAGADCLQIEQLSLAHGESLFIRGPSGCGKSTLLSLLAGVLTAKVGHVGLQGQCWSKLSAAKRDRRRADHIGYIFQQFNLLPYLSLRDNVLLTCRLSRSRALRAGPDPWRAAETWLRAMGLGEELWQRRAVELSVGQQQRVAAARALIGQPELIIADEPTSALDEPLRDAFIDRLLSACKAAGSGLLFVSHDRGLAQRFDRQVDLAALNRAYAAAAEPQR